MQLLRASDAGLSVCVSALGGGRGAGAPARVPSVPFLLQASHLCLGNVAGLGTSICFRYGPEKAKRKKKKKEGYK